MRLTALIDLTVLAVVFGAVYSLKFIGVSNIGVLTMAATGAAGLAIMAVRRISLADVGLKALRRGDVRLFLEAAGVIGLTVLLAPAIISVFGPLQQSTVITEQPTTLSGFLIDIVFFTWLAAGLGEEFVFRGVILERMRTFFGRGGIGLVLAALGQAVWFGAGHAGQGLSGVVLTGTIGFALALFFLFRAKGSLWPQIFAHAAVDTVVLSLSFLARTTG